MTRKGTKFVLKDNQHPSLRHRTGFIKEGTTGEVIGVRQLLTDPEECLLIKFKGVSGPRHVQKSWGEI